MKRLKMEATDFLKIWNDDFQEKELAEYGIVSEE